MVFCGTFDAKGTKLAIGGGRLEILKAGAIRKLVGAVDQITFSGVDVERDVLAHMDFRPALSDALAEMPALASADAEPNK